MVGIGRADVRERQQEPTVVFAAVMTLGASRGQPQHLGAPRRLAPAVSQIQQEKTPQNSPGPRQACVRDMPKCLDPYSLMLII